MTEQERIIREVLDGIDRAEGGWTAPDGQVHGEFDGWWETTTGAVFGHEKLEELIARLADLESK